MGTHTHNAPSNGLTFFAHAPDGAHTQTGREAHGNTQQRSSEDDSSEGGVSGDRKTGQVTSCLLFAFFLLRCDLHRLRRLRLFSTKAESEQTRTHCKESKQMISGGDQ